MFEENLLSKVSSVLNDSKNDILLEFLNWTLTRCMKDKVAMILVDFLLKKKTNTESLLTKLTL
jgi:hypothetical protein